MNTCLQYLNSENEEINLFAFEQAILGLEGEEAGLADREKDIINSVCASCQVLLLVISSYKCFNLPYFQGG